MKVLPVNNNIYNKNQCSFKTQKKQLSTKDKIKETAMYSVLFCFIWNHIFDLDIFEYIKKAPKTGDKIVRTVGCLGVVTLLGMMLKEQWDKWSK